ncbi:MAG: alpha-L-fucosidase [Bacteroidales bacterium]|nr:alpha-L-fucosidase [Bacteroidales bacterium]
MNQTILDVNSQCVIFSNGGPGCRWVGNENGDAAETNWGTINIIGRGLSPSNLPGNYESYLSGGDEGGDTWCPAECDFSIQQIGDHNGWFYGADDSRKTARQLMDLYYKSVGRNGVFLMNVPPSDQGVIDAKEKKVIEEFTAMRESVFGTNLADGATATATKVRGSYAAKYGPQNLLDGNFDTYFATDDADAAVDIEITLSGSKTFNRVMLQEYIPLGQRVKSFTVQYKNGGGWTTWKSGTTIGYKRILMGPSVTADAVKIQIKSSLACPVLNGFGLYNDTVSGL